MAKKLLNEAVVRRFQSLANISPINEMYHKEEKEEEKMEEVKHDDEDKMEEAVEEAMHDDKEKMEEGSYMEADMKKWTWMLTNQRWTTWMLIWTEILSLLMMKQMLSLLLERNLKPL
jgi:ABC-type Zn2+ transport system substrate-binding protein/surface adhesin